MRDCRKEEECDLPSQTVVRLPIDPERWEAGYGPGSEDIMHQAFLLELSDALMCDVGVEVVDRDERGLRLGISHNCQAEEETIATVSADISRRIAEQVEGAEFSVELPVEGTRIEIPPEYEGAAISEGCTVFKGGRYLVAPTRRCVNEVRRALSQEGFWMNLPEAWGAAEEGERVVLFEDMLGSYLFYKLPSSTLLPTGVCYDLYERGAIDGHRLRHYHLPKEIRDAARGKFGSGKELLEWYLDHEGLNLSRGGGACEGLTQLLKSSGLAAGDWAWFADRGENLVVLDPDGAEEILVEHGFSVEAKDYEIDHMETTEAGVSGIRCNLREHQIGPVRAWKERVSRVERLPEYSRALPEEERIPVAETRTGDIRRLTGRQKEAYEKMGRVAFERETGLRVEEALGSTSGPPVAGGYIKSPTGSGKTVMGMVIFGTLGDVEGTVSEGECAPRSEAAAPEAAPEGEGPEPGDGAGVGEISRERLISLVRERRDAGVPYADIIEEVEEDYGDKITRNFIYYHTKGGGSD